MDRWENQKISSSYRAYNACSWNKSNTDLFNKFRSQISISPLKTSVQESKQKYYCHLSGKLLDSKTSPKSYWSIWKTFLNNKKIPCIPPLLHSDRFIMNFKEKAELFNESLLKQYSHTYLKKRASNFQQLSFRHMMS